MRLTGSRTYYRSTPPKMPSGLVELIEGLTKEVLKNNPADIYGFCAGHVQQLLEIRDGPLQKKILTLEEKIAKAQEKVRQRAEQRRKQYNNDLLNEQKGKGPEIKTIKVDSPTILPQEPTALDVLQKLTQNEQDLGNSSEAELSQKMYTPSGDPQNQEIKDSTTKDDDLKNDIKSEPKDTEYESKIVFNLAETSNEISDSIVTQDSTLNELPKAETPATTVEMLHNLFAPMVYGQITHVETQSFQEDQELVAEAGVLQEFGNLSNSSPDPQQHLLSPITSINTNQYRGRELEKISDLCDQNSVTQAANIISNDIVETQSNNVNLPLNKDETQSNDTESIQNIIDPDNQSNIIDTVELTNSSDDTINGKEEDHQETNTIDISYKESPAVELQDSQINSDMLESLLETNTDSDIVTLITQESINGEFRQHNAFTENAELPEGNNDNADTNGVLSGREELQENTQHQNQINNTDLIENNNEEKTDIDYSGHDEYMSTKLNVTPQIHNQDSNMDLETAAVTIQKVFRTFLFKSRASTFDDTVDDATTFLNDVDKNKEETDFPIAGSLNERRPHGITRMDTVLQTVNEEKSLSLSTDDSSTLSSAATVIQAHVRGFLVRNKLNSNKTISTNSLAASNEPSLTSLEMDNEQNKNKTVLNIHIVPEGGNYLSRDESLITSMDLSLDSSPPSSINLHPLGYDKSERRKQLKREDAIQSISPPSNNSGKLSEDVDSVKELPLNDLEITLEHQTEINVLKDDMHEGTNKGEGNKEDLAENVALETIVSDNAESAMKQKESVEKMNSDEMDVVTPFTSSADNKSSDRSLIHSGEFHDAVLPTKVSRSDTSVASGE